MRTIRRTVAVVAACVATTLGVVAPATATVEGPYWYQNRATGRCMSDVVTRNNAEYSYGVQYGLLMNRPCDGRQENLFFHDVFNGNTRPGGGVLPGESYTIRSSVTRHLWYYDEYWGVRWTDAEVCAQPIYPGGDNADIELVLCDFKSSYQHWRTRDGHANTFESASYTFYNSCIDGYAGANNTVFTYTCDGSREQDWI